MQEKWKAVLVEDEQLIRQDLMKKIEACSPEFQIVAQAENGLQALELVEQWKPDVVFTDMRMPIMNGMELIDKIHRRYPRMKLVVLSGYSDFAYLQQSISCGVSAYLLKPVEQDALRETLQKLKGQLRQEQLLQTPEIIRSEAFHQPTAGSLWYLLAVCLGNLKEDQQEPRQLPVHWENILAELLPGGNEWSVLSLGANERLIFLRTDRQTNMRAAAHSLMLRLEGALPQIPVQTAFSLQPQAEEATIPTGMRLKNLLQYRVVAGQSGSWVLEEAESPQVSAKLNILKMRIQENLNQAVRDGSQLEINQEWSMIVKFMVQNQVPQIYAEQMLQEMLQLCGKAKAREAGEKAAACFRNCCSPEEVEQAMLALLQEPEEMQGDLPEQMRSYLDDHYQTLEHLEQIRVQFHYSYSYLSKLFRERFGVTPHQYVQQKRIDMAKELLQTDARLNASQVADLCGFSDRRNFLRVFKTETGLSPSEYRRDCWKK